MTLPPDAFQLYESCSVSGLTTSAVMVLLPLGSVDAGDAFSELIFAGRFGLVPVVMEEPWSAPVTGAGASRPGVGCDRALLVDRAGVFPALTAKATLTCAVREDRTATRRVDVEYAP